MSEPTRVLIAHPPRLFTECLAVALDQAHSVDVVGHVTTPTELLDVVGQVAADVLLLDSSIRPDGAALVADVCQAAPNTRVLALTQDDAGGAEEMIRAGARGYLDYNCGVQELVRCIERVSTGDVVVIAGTPGDGGAPREQPRRSGFSVLTRRERDVLDLVVEGRTNAEIAGALCITNHTVKGHLAKILRKLGLQNRVQLTALVMQRRLGDRVREPVRVPD